MKKLTFITAGLATLAISAIALGGFMTTFDKTYGVEKDSVLGKSKCLVCHTDKAGKKLNLYGTDLQKAMKSAGTKKLTAAILKAVEQMDSNGNGRKNIDEIKADSLPGKK
jgi:hypothetical protein